MILVDYSQVMLASLFANIGNHHNIDIDENLIRHMFLNSLRANRKKFNEEFGEIVICVDSTNGWRKELYPYYKANRSKSRGESELDWNELFRIINMIRDELEEFFPYKVLKVDRCEADDIIGTIAHEYGTELNIGAEQILILSGDKDYIQLHTYANVKQYDPVRKKWVRNQDPAKYLVEHILKGDTGDGVPNILSPDNCLAIGERQKPMTAKRIELYSKGTDDMDAETLRRFHRNRTMIDLSEVPEKYKKQTIEEFNKEKKISRNELFNYFMHKKLKNLITDIQDF